MHLNAETVLDLLDGRLDQDQEVFWKRHLDVCRECTQEAERWKELSSHLKRSSLKSASEQVLQKAMEIFPNAPEGERNPIRSVLASIVFDSFLQPAFSGARGATSTARQLVMHAEEFDIHVKIWGDDNHRQMLGQLLPRSREDFVQRARFHLLRNGERIETTAVDDMGEFHFIDVPEGNLSLQIDLPNLTVIGALNVKGINP
jgi:hypothetical protein